VATPRTSGLDGSKRLDSGGLDGDEHATIRRLRATLRIVMA